MSESYEQARACLDSDCPGKAEPEEELAEGGLLRYWVCGTCDMEFGHEQVKDDTAAGSCQLGIPAAVRERASAPPSGQPERVFLGNTIGRRPE